MHKVLQLLAGAAFCAALGATAPALAQDKVTYNMSWLPQGSSIGVAVAKEKGWFQKVGLDVSIIRGYGGNRTAAELDQGRFQVGYVDPISLVLNRLHGGAIKLIGAINTQWPAGICWVTERHQIHGIDDLKDLTMGGGSASPVQEVVPAWLDLNGKPRTFIHMVRMDPAVVDTSLIQGKIDLAECWKASNREVEEKLAKAAGVHLAWIDYSQYKLDAYGSGFAARDSTIQKDPEMLRKFLAESYRGYTFARENPKQASAIILKMFPTMDPGVALAQIYAINKLIYDPSVADKGLGYFRKDRMASTLAFVDTAFNLKKGQVKLDDIYTDSLLGK